MIPVKPKIARRAEIRSLEEYERQYRESIDHPQRFWRKQAEALTWFHPPQTTLDVDVEEVDFSWFGGGRLNACFNCVDRHIEQHGEKTATGKTRPTAGTRVREMWAKLKRGGHESRYRLRKIVVEPVFGHIKAARGFRQFLLNHFPDPDILLNKERMDERAALARDNALPVEEIQKISAVYLGIAEKITGKKIELSSNPKQEIIDILRDNYSLIDE